MPSPTSSSTTSSPPESDSQLVHCYLCDELKPLTQFYKDESRRSRVSSACKRCLALKRSADSRREVVRRSLFKGRHGIDVADFDATVELYGGCCPLCMRKIRLCLDKDPSNAIRGVTCQRCLTKLRSLEDRSQKSLELLLGGPQDAFARYLLSPPGLPGGKKGGAEPLE